MTIGSIPDLRPRTMGQILDQAIRIYRRNLGRFVGIVAIVQVPLTLLQMGMSYLTVSGAAAGLTPTSSSFGSILGPGYFIGLLGTVVTTILTLVLLWGVAAGALSWTVAGLYIGNPSTFRGAWQHIARYVPRLIGAILFAVALGLLAIVWAIIPCIGWLSGFGFLIFFIGAIIPLIAPAIVIEGQSAVGAVRRAWDLVRRRFWWVTGFVIILYLFNLLVVGGPGAIVTMILQTGAGRALTSGDMASTLVVQTVVQSLSSLILSLIYLPLQLTCMVLMYLDLRVRTEGLDLTLQTARALPGEMTLAQALAYAPPSRSNLITWREVGYFVLISLGAIALVGFVYAIMMALVLLAFAGTM